MTPDGLRAWRPSAEACREVGCHLGRRCSGNGLGHTGKVGADNGSVDIPEHCLGERPFQILTDTSDQKGS